MGETTLTQIRAELDKVHGSDQGFDRRGYAALAAIRELCTAEPVPWRADSTLNRTLLDIHTTTVAMQPDGASQLYAGAATGLIKLYTETRIPARMALWYIRDEHRDRYIAEWKISAAEDEVAARGPQHLRPVAHWAYGPNPGHFELKGHAARSTFVQWRIGHMGPT